MTELYVAKFGGTSVNYPHKIDEIIRGDPRRKVVVVSAPGKFIDSTEYPYDEKVTDMLIAVAEKRRSNNDQERIQDVINSVGLRYSTLFPDFLDVVDYGLEDLRHRVFSLDICNVDPDGVEYNKYLDNIKAWGEEWCARLYARQFSWEYIDAAELLRVTNNFGDAEPFPRSDEIIREKIGIPKNVNVIPGFYGITDDGYRATLKRGGSDITGAVLASALKADLYENFTDRKGVCAADPRIVDNPETIPIMTYIEMYDLAYSGSEILNHDAVEQVRLKNVPIHIRSTFAYPEEGTRICCYRKWDISRPITGIAYRNGFYAINIFQPHMNDTPGIFERVGRVFADRGIPIEHMPTGIDDMTVIFRSNSEKINGLATEISNELYSIRGETPVITDQNKLGCLVISGESVSLPEFRAVPSDVNSTLVSSGIYPEFVIRGSQKRCAIYVIDDADAKKAINLVYDMFFFFL